MASLAFDTHAFVKDLTASGMPTEQAEVLARTYATLLTDRLATTEDLALQDDRIEAEFLAVRSDIAAMDKKFTAEFVQVRGEIAAMDKKFTGEIAALEEKMEIKLSALEDRLTARIALSQLATIIILTGVIGAFNFWG